MNITLSPGLLQEFRLDPISNLVDPDNFCNILSQLCRLGEPTAIVISYMLTPNNSGKVLMAIAVMCGAKQINRHVMNVSPDILRSAFIEPATTADDLMVSTFQVLGDGSLIRSSIELITV